MKPYLAEYVDVNGVNHAAEVNADENIIDGYHWSSRCGSEGRTIESCTVCGGSYVSPRSSAMTMKPRPGMCFHCECWLWQSEEDAKAKWNQRIIVDHNGVREHYSIGSVGGFAGAQFKIRNLETDNVVFCGPRWDSGLWSHGTIPKFMWDKFPVNAIMERFTPEELKRD